MPSIGQRAGVRNTVPLFKPGHIFFSIASTFAITHLISFGVSPAAVLAFHFSDAYVDSAIDPATVIQDTMRKEGAHVA